MIGPNVITSGAKTATGTSNAMPLGSQSLRLGQQLLELGLNITAVSGTTPTLDLTVEWSFDGGVTFLVGEPADTFTQKTAAGSGAKVFTAKGNAYRVKWTIGGTTPSFTFSVTEVQH